MEKRRDEAWISGEYFGAPHAAEDLGATRTRRVTGNGRQRTFCGKGIDITTGRHMRYPEESGRLANLQLSLLEKLGVPEERFGDSTGKLELLTGL